MNIWDTYTSYGGGGSVNKFRGPIMGLVGNGGYDVYGVCQGGGCQLAWYGTWKGKLSGAKVTWRQLHYSV